MPIFRHKSTYPSRIRSFITWELWSVVIHAYYMDDFAQFPQINIFGCTLLTVEKLVGKQSKCSGKLPPGCSVMSITRLFCLSQPKPAVSHIEENLISFTKNPSSRILEDSLHDENSSRSWTQSFPNGSLRP